METSRGPWIQTASGTKFYPLDPRCEDVAIVDIAHALGNLCRFTGHTRCFYSVAQHSVLVSRHVPPKYALAALLHDAAEAYIGDISRPLKQGLRYHTGPYLDQAEDRLQRVIHQRFHVTIDDEGEAAIKQADIAALVTEARDVLSFIHPDWKYSVTNGYQPLPEIIHPLPPFPAEWAFLMRFLELTESAATPSR